ncbi:hypothetical protein FE257_003770 [Aspergillus nanangensis]|uniref:SPRY domain-containing protein n=1 Tax=Aspergillus nanangensis TaxID=2582783 RepID=A0AAD4CBN1_ASPNN|nr:hypothetical protein FE257_003770 [Aspergillus nanangensis]
MDYHTPKSAWGAPPSYQASQSSAHVGRDISAEHESQPPPYHNWQDAVPDTTTFPPPPVTGHFCSGTGNALADDADRAHAFCDEVPLHRPVRPSRAVYSAVQSHDIRPVQPGEFHGGIDLISQGHWRGFTMDGNGDCLVSTHLPLYFAMEDSPFVTETSKTIYFEVKLLRLRAGPGAGSGDSSGLSIGFLAHPYPYWRSPGWERGSLGVFSDDGCRFVNDSWGGTDFTAAFGVGETVGLGMTIQLPENINSDQKDSKGKAKVDIFFTRNGQIAGGWDLHEEVDEQAGGVMGLEGDFDLYGAIGLFGGVDFEVIFKPEDLLWRPLRV